MSINILTAIFSNDIAEVEKLRNTGVDLLEISEKEHWNYLHQSLLMSHRYPEPEMISYLIGIGVDANLIDCYGNNSLHYAVKVKNVDVVNVLIENGADVNQLNNEGISPLRQVLAVSPIDYSVVQLLIGKGANLDNKPIDGISDLELAKIVGSSDSELASIMGFELG